MSSTPARKEEVTLNKSIKNSRLHSDCVFLCIGALLLFTLLVIEIAIYFLHVLHANILLRLLQAVFSCAVLYCGAYLHRHRTHSDKVLRTCFYVFFAVYLYLLLSMTLLDETLGRSGNSIYRLLSEGARIQYISRFVNLIPFQSIYKVYILGCFNGYVNLYYTLLNLLGNVVAFMPLAFFLPYFFRSLRKWYSYLAVVVGAVFLIELLQFVFMVGSCDVDDLLLNAGGSMLMYAILRIPPIQRLTRLLTGADIR